MPIKTRSSILAIKEEVTEGVPILSTVSSSGDAVALQDGFSFGPETELQENAELRSSIGVAKPFIGIERANAEISHYVRHSGVEGTKPGYSELLKSVFGAEDVEGTEYDTTAGSTTGVIALPSGEGVNFRRGQGLLIKDPTNGRSVRAIRSVSGDNLTLNFKLATAPGSGVNLGKNVGWLPANDGHPTLTLDLFRGNGGIRELISGARVTTLELSATAGEFINGAYTIQGVKYYFNPIELTSSNNKLDFNDGTDRSVTIEAKVYRDPHELAAAIQTALNDSPSSDTFTVIWNDYGASKGKFTLTSSGGTFSLEFATGANTAQTIAPKIGFAVADETGATTYTSDVEQSWAAPFSAVYDSADPRVAKSGEILFGSQSDNASLCVQEITATIEDARQEINCIRADTAIDGSIIDSRTVTVNFIATAEKHDAQFFKPYRTGDEVQLMFTFGQKVGSQWKEGTVVSLYLETATVTEFVTEDADGLVVFNVTLQGFVDNEGNGEVYLNML